LNGFKALATAGRTAVIVALFEFSAIELLGNGFPNAGPDSNSAPAEVSDDFGLIEKCTCRGSVVAGVRGESSEAIRSSVCEFGVCNT